jgi:hypothetical protein
VEVVEIELAAPEEVEEEEQWRSRELGPWHLRQPIRHYLHLRFHACLDPVYHGSGHVEGGPRQRSWPYRRHLLRLPWLTGSVRKAGGRKSWRGRDGEERLSL